MTSSSSSPDWQKIFIQRVIQQDNVDLCALFKDGFWFELTANSSKRLKNYIENPFVVKIEIPKTWAWNTPHPFIEISLIIDQYTKGAWSLRSRDNSHELLFENINDAVVFKLFYVSP